MQKKHFIKQLNHNPSSMSNVQYRIAKTRHGYHPMVRRKRFIGWGKWYQVSKHIDGYGLYSTLSYPKDKHDCEIIIEDYHNWSDSITFLNYPHL